MTYLQAAYMTELRAFTPDSDRDIGYDRQRVMDSSKRLMARDGYERTSIEAVAEDAGVAEAAVLSLFGSKDGLLEAVFNESWGALNTRLADIVMAAVNMREATLGMLTAMLHTLGKDRDLALLLLFESRRQHGNNCEIRLSRGFRDFESLLLRVFQRGQKDGSFSPDLDPRSVTSALLGAAEGMMRDRALADMLGEPMPFTEAQLRSTFASLICRLTP